MAIEEKDIWELAETLSGLSEAQGQVLMARTTWAMAESLLCCGYRKFEIVDEPPVPADGGPAFGELKQAGNLAIKQGGLTIRDYFAAAALQGMLANPEFYKEAGRRHEDGEAARKDLTSTAYSFADAAMQERAK